MTDENLIKEAIDNQNNNALDCLINRYKDIVNANYTLAVEKGKAFVHTENPYIQVNEINGIELPKEKQKKFHIGPQVGVGFGVDVNRKIFVTPSVGIGVTWSLISF